MIERSCGLNDSALEAIAGLERRVVAADSGRLKLEWGTLRSRPADEVRDLLAWEDNRLVGFLGIYGHSWKHLELTGMVDPATRRRGIGRALFDAVLPLCREQRKDRLLLVVPRSSPAGAAFARGRGMSFEHSEHALALRERPQQASATERIELRAATTGDIPVLSKLYDDAFHDGGHVDPSRLTSERSRTLLICCDDEPVGTITVAREARRGAVYGFAVAPAWRGRGIGRQVLRRVCQQQFDGGAERVDLEVEVENDGALGLYTSVGFTLEATDDYYELIL
ncbi:MAG TPA: GNAT family N-acetyltransferase [Solirubrobacteraceae bacterium]|nr:GNAT family N-acetyltransferase [Solirubrobacteraceae bacterium]